MERRTGWGRSQGSLHAFEPDGNRTVLPSVQSASIPPATWTARATWGVAAGRAFTNHGADMMPGPVTWRAYVAGRSRTSSTTPRNASRTPG